MCKIPYKLYLTEKQTPNRWYNIKADMKNSPDPLINSKTLKPVKENELSSIFCEELVKQELDYKNSYIDIPEEILEIYKIYRPSALTRAYNLEKALKTPAKIYYKLEGSFTASCHKINSAVAQVYYAKKQGVKGLVTETGSGQWGTALAEACDYFEIPLTVFMVNSSYKQKPYRKIAMQTFGANVISSPSYTTNIGYETLKINPQTSGSLGCAISEAIETLKKNSDYRYVTGSVLDQVLLHQSIIGLECKKGMEILDEYPDIIIGNAGGGTNLGGLIVPFVKDKLEEKKNPYIIAVEAKSCPSLSRGKYTYDFCDFNKIIPLAKMYTLGSSFIPSPNHSGGMRYHGISPIISKLYNEGYINEARAVSQNKVFESAIYFAKKEMLLPSPEAAHTIKVVIDEALKCKETGEKKTILFGLIGTGYFDMAAYDEYNKGKMEDYIPNNDDINESFSQLPKL